MSGQTVGAILVRIPLPLCQITNHPKKTSDDIFELLGEEKMQNPWFMDTLCVPRSKSLEPTAKRARRLLISELPAIYADAEFVLVIDEEIMSFSLSLEILELMFRICNCRWSERLWTLQESSFAQQLFFLFSDGIASLEDLISKGPNVKYDLLMQNSIGHLTLSMNTSQLLTRSTLISCAIDC